MRRRRRAEIRFQLYGMAAIAIGLAFLVILFTSIISNGWTAFFQTSIELPITFDAEEIDPDGNRSPKRSRRRPITRSLPTLRSIRFSASIPQTALNGRRRTRFSLARPTPSFVKWSRPILP